MNRLFIQLFTITIVVLCYSCVASHNTKTKFVSIVWNPVTNRFKSIDDEIVPGCAAWAAFSDQIHDNGWSFLKVVTNEDFPDRVQAYAAGLAEGRLTGKHMRDIWDSWVGKMCDPLTGSNIELCDDAWRFMRINQEWMKHNIDRFANTDPYWHQVDLLQCQMEGIQDGSEDKAYITHSDNILFQEFGFWLFTITSDLTEGLLAKFNYTLQHVNDHLGSCSVLIKLLPNNTDLYVAHDTWDWYTSMVRIIKNYEFNYHLTDHPGSPIVPGFNITFSSYPGAIQSIDDYYLISSGLATLETTLNIYNESLLDFIQPQSVLEAFRVMLANRLATDGQTWADIFIEHNSGTYNNEWMIVDYKLFQPGNSTLNDGLLWIVEQLPGYCEAADVTPVLREQGYWASYNIPYFKSVFDLSNQQSVVDKYGAIVGSYNESNRALIFRREEVNVLDIESMKKLMRYNNYEHDPYSMCPNCTPHQNAVMSIAARADLNPANGTYAPHSYGHSAFGAIDMKLTNCSMFETLQFIAIGGPTHETVPAFQWSTYNSQGLKIKHAGQPDLWNFGPVLTVWD